MAKIRLKSYIKSIHGRLGNVVYYNTNGRQYARTYTVPRNPRTERQQQNRILFGEASKCWRELPDNEKEFYRALAEDRPLSGYNIFMSMKMRGTPIKTRNHRGSEQASFSLLSAGGTLRNTSVYSPPRLQLYIITALNYNILRYRPPGSLKQAS